MKDKHWTQELHSSLFLRNLKAEVTWKMQQKYSVRQKNLTVFKSRYIDNHVG